MTGLDTNILVRYVLKDDARQLAAVDRLFETLSQEAPAFVTLITVVELVWVLEGCGYKRSQIFDVLSTLLAVREVIVEGADSLTLALADYTRGNADLADCLIATHSRKLGCATILTFDRKAAQTAGMTLLEA